MRVWVSTFGLYNNGYLAGYWVEAAEAPLTVADFKAGFKKDASMLPDDSIIGDELWCFDTEDFPPSTGEMSPADARRWSLLYEVVGEHNAEAFIAYCDNVHPGKIPSDDYVQGFEDAYCGQFDSFKDFVENWFTETEVIPEHLERYIDWDIVTNDYRYDFWHVDADGYRVDVFRNL
jgi:hypothetical protein